MQIIKPQKDESGKYPAFAWPGGYPLFYVIEEDNSVCCPKCANDSERDGTLTAGDINYEDTDLFCDFCNERISSAYGDD